MEGAISMVISGSTLLSVLAYILRNEHRITKVETKIDLIIKGVKCIWEGAESGGD